MTTLVQIPFHGTNIAATDALGKPMASVRHMCESIGLDYSGQLQRIKRSSWGTVGMMPMVTEDGKRREVVMIDRRVMTIWLATVETSRIKDSAVRETLEAFQNEAADALDSYFHEGGAINPSATTAQITTLDTQLSSLRVQAEIAHILRGVVADAHLDNVGRIILARAMGEAPAIERAERSLTTSDFLKEKSVKTKESMRIRSMFGRRLSGAYLAHHGEEPPSAPELVNGRERDVKYYTEKDRHLFDQVWEDHYAEEYEPNFMEELNA